MRVVRILVGLLLCSSGVIHLAQILAGRPTVETVVTVGFGAAYVATGLFLLRDGRTACLAGVVVPLIGLLLAVAGMLAKPSVLGAFFIAVDIIVAGSCLYVLAGTKHKYPA